MKSIFFNNKIKIENGFIYYKIRKIRLRLMIDYFLIILLVFSLIFTPRDSLQLKKISFLLILLINFDVIIVFLLQNRNHIILFFAVFFPMILTIISFLITGDIFTSFRQSYVFLYLLIIPVILKYNIKYKNIVIIALKILVALIVISGFLDLFNIVTLNQNIILKFFESRGEANVGVWPTATFNYIMFFKTSPLIMILIAYATNKKKKMIIILSLLAVAFTGTRANLYAGFLVFIFSYIITWELSYKKLIFFFIISFILIFKINDIIDYIINLQVADSNSDNIKIEHLISIMKLMKNNPLYIITGSGLGSYFYSSGRDKLVNLTELSFFEWFRQTGIIGFIPFMYFIFKPILDLWKKKSLSWLIVGYIGFLMIAFTNPLLFSSTPFVLYILIYLSFYRYRPYKIKN
jgi:hypothetical protein